MSRKEDKFRTMWDSTWPQRYQLGAPMGEHDATVAAAVPFSFTPRDVREARGDWRFDFARFPPRIFPSQTLEDTRALNFGNLHSS